MPEPQLISEIRVAPVETYFGAPGEGRIVGRSSKGDIYGINQPEWLVQITTDGGLTGITNARPAMNRGSLAELHDTLSLLVGRAGLGDGGGLPAT